MSAVKFMSTLTVCSVFAALLSIVWQAFIALKELNKITAVLTFYLSIESSHKLIKNAPIHNVAIGYGACSDLLIDGILFLNYTEVAFRGLGSFANTSDEIKNSKELLQSFAYYFHNGAAAERFMSNSLYFNELIKIAKTQHREHINWSLGGNAALMGLRFYLEGSKVLLGARMSPKLRRLLPDGIQITGDPLDEDEIHLILEYKTGDKWGELIAPRANRFILHSDRNNPQLQVAEQFGEVLKTFKPRLYVVTGLHVMDKYKFEPGVRENRLFKVHQQLQMQGDNTLTHFEMASYVDIDLLQLLCQHILPYIDSLGMNEQELENLVSVLTKGKTTTLTHWNPDIGESLDQTRQIYQHIVNNYYEKVGELNDSGNRRRRLLSRIHVHTLGYQIILTKRDSQWHNNTVAVVKAALTAHRYVCQTELINPESASLLLPDKYYTSARTTKTNARKQIILDPKNPIACWLENIEITNQHPIEIEICVAPVLICRLAKKAAGAGDNISAAALSQQL